MPRDEKQFNFTVPVYSVVVLEETLLSNASEGNLVIG